MDLLFTYNSDAKRMECRVAKVYIKHAGGRPPSVEFILFWDNKEILFRADQKIEQDKGTDTELISWVLTSISSPFLDRRQQYSYSTEEERDKAVDIMLSFLSQYDGYYNKDKVRGRAKIISVKLTDYLQKLLYHGKQ